MCDLPHRSRRQAFTLVELMVVIIIIAVIATLAVVIAPRIGQQGKAGRGADQLQSWLLIAKQRALRDRVPTGIRFLVDSNNQATKLAYVQQPDDFTGGAFSKAQSAGATVTADFIGVDFTGDGLGQGVADQSPVLPGDYLELNGGGPVIPITNVNNATQLQLKSLPVNPTNSTTNYRIIRQPRPLAGEDPLLLPQDVIIDFSAVTVDATTSIQLSPNTPKRTVGTSSFYEIIFSPSGGVVGQGTSTQNKIGLFFRDVTRDNLNDGEPVVLTVNVRTGQIAIFPVDFQNYPNNLKQWVPYNFASDPRASGT
jgi:prepilin-type N-terminal cleavage/methylation domain-containing protein